MNLISIAANPAPDAAICSPLNTPDGVILRVARWLAPTAHKGTVLLLQGRGEFIEKYFETIHDLRSRGFAVVAFDWRGQGFSDRKGANGDDSHVRHFSDYSIDLKAVMEQVVLPDCPPPIFALGHSLGGAIAIRACHEGNNWFERIVLTAPLIALSRHRLNKMAGPMLRCLRLLGYGSAHVSSKHWTAIAEERFTNNPLTSDPVRYARMVAILQKAPELNLGTPTIAWADAALRSMKDFVRPAYAEKIRQPMLMVAAGDDDIVSTEAIEAFAAKLLAGRHLTVAGARHEILQERDHYRKQFWAAFDAFVPGTRRY